GGLERPNSPKFLHVVDKDLSHSYLGPLSRLKVDGNYRLWGSCGNMFSKQAGVFGESENTMPNSINVVKLLECNPTFVFDAFAVLLVCHRCRELKDNHFT